MIVTDFTTFLSKMHFSAKIFHRFPDQLLTCYKLAKVLNCAKKMAKFKEKIQDRTLTLGSNYQKYYTDLIDGNSDLG